MSIEFIFVEAARVLGQALRITFMLFWWLGVGIMGISRHISERTQERQVKTAPFTATGQKSSGTVCATCSAMNEAGSHRCYSCGSHI